MFSIIIPLYNKERHVQKTLESVLNQTSDDYEIIVINDGSTDQSLKKVHDVESDKIRVYSQENKGVSVARNNGANKANYDYLLFLDADDGLMPSYLSDVSELIEDYPKAGIYATNFYNYKSKFDVFLERPVPFLPKRGIVDNYFELMLDRGSILASVSVMKKDVFEKSGGYVRGMQNGEDTFLLTKILLTENLGFLNKPLYYRTYDSDNKASERYRPADTEISLLDYLGTGTGKADDYIIDYSLYQVKSLIKSGYTDEAMELLDSIKEVVPARLSEQVEREINEINTLKRRPFQYYEGKKRVLKHLVFLKDILKYKLNFPL